jgi:hypothetical protein
LFTGWTSWTPTLTAVSVNPNIGSTGTTVGRYLKIGRMVIFTATIESGGSGIAAGTGEYRINLPVNTSSVFSAIASGWVFSTAAGRGIISLDNFVGTSQLRMLYQNGTVGSGSFGVGAGFSLSISGTYQSAA